MSKKVLTLDLATGKKILETVIDDATNAAGSTTMAYTAKAVDEKVSAIGSSITGAITKVKNESSYQNAVAGIYATPDGAPKVDKARYIIGTQFKIYHAEIQQSGTSGKPGYIDPKAEYWELVSTAELGATVYNCADNREYRYEPFRKTALYFGVNETVWFDTNLQDKKIVNVIDDQTIAGIKTFTANAEFQENVHIAKKLQVDGDLIVSGTTTQIDTENLVVKDNIILLNDGDLGQGDGSGITTGAAGLEVNRGKEIDGKTDLPKAQILFAETPGKWKAGLENELLVVARVDDDSIESETETYSINRINQLITNVQGVITGSTLTSFNAAEDITLGDIVYITNDGSVAKASNTNLSCINLIAGVATQTAPMDEVVKVAKFGKVDKFGGLQVGKPYFLGVNGTVTTTVPSESGEIICMIGSSVSATEMLLQIGEAIQIA